MRPSDLKPHPRSIAIYGEDEVAELIESIRQHGILEPLVVRPDGTILSGHRRWRAALALSLADLPTRTLTPLTDLDEREAIVHFNRQRVKNFSQRMREAEELEAVEQERAKRRQIAQLKRGAEAPVQEMFPEREKGQTRDKVAAAVGLGSGRTYEKAAKVWEAAKSGDASARALVAELDAGKTTIHAAFLRLQREADLERQRQQIASGQVVAPTGLFEVIVIDPPWPYGTRYDPDGRRAASPYPEMSLERLAKLELPAAKDCVLWLWTTHRFMRAAFPLLDAWGFREVAILTWVKDRIGLGSWLRSQSEFCIMAVKGSPRIQLSNQSTVIHGPVREHSRKPDEFYALVESLCFGRKLDFFSREARPGWEVFGNDTGRFAS